MFNLNQYNVIFYLNDNENIPKELHRVLKKGAKIYGNRFLYIKIKKISYDHHFGMDD